MVTEQEVEDLKQATRPWGRLVQIQCTKSPDVVKRTAELLAEVGHDEGVKHLKGQRVYMRIVCLLFIMLLAHVHD